ncbi:glycosyltransferase [Alsobacter sp. R-9]
MDAQAAPTRSAKDREQPASRWTGRTVVSLTPNSLTSDSRTLKQAVTFARLGARSVVIEGRPSGQDFGRLGLEVRSIGSEGSAGASAGPANVSASAPKNSRRLPDWLKHPVVFAITLWALLTKQWWPAYRMMPPADLIILHSFHFLPAAVVAKWRHGAPIIYDAHDFYSDMDATAKLTPFERGWLVPFYAFMDRRAIKAASAFLTVSDGVADLYERWSGRRPMVLRNVHDERLDRRPLPQTVRERCSIPPGDTLVVAIGNAKRGAAIEGLIRCMSHLPASTHVAFVGGGFGEFAPLVAALGVESRVHFCGRIPADEVVPFVESADMAVVLYFAETENYEQALPNRFFQSISARLPLLYPPLPRLREIATAFNFGVEFDPLSSQSLLAGLSRLGQEAGSPALREGLARAAKALSWQSEEGKLLDIAEQALGKASRPARGA